MNIQCERCGLVNQDIRWCDDEDACRDRALIRHYVQRAGRQHEMIETIAGQFAELQRRGPGWHRDLTAGELYMEAKENGYADVLRLLEWFSAAFQRAGEAARPQWARLALRSIETPAGFTD